MKGRVPTGLSGFGVREGSLGQEADLLAKHFVVQLQLVQPLQLLRQPVIALPQLLDVIAGFGENPPFTLQERPTQRGLDYKIPACFPKQFTLSALLSPRTLRGKGDCCVQPRDTGACRPGP